MPHTSRPGPGVDGRLASGLTVSEIDDRIFFRGIKGGWPQNESIQHQPIADGDLVELDLAQLELCKPVGEFHVVFEDVVHLVIRQRNQLINRGPHNARVTVYRPR